MSSRRFQTMSRSASFSRTQRLQPGEADCTGNGDAEPRRCEDDKRIVLWNVQYVWMGGKNLDKASGGDCK
jgi:hypothetical protein